MRGYPLRHIVLDTETESTQLEGDPPTTELTLRLGCIKVYDPFTEPKTDGAYFFFADTNTLHSYLDMMPCNQEPIIILAHNMGFDSRIAGFFRELACGNYAIEPPEGTPGAGRYTSPFVVIEDSPFIVRLFRRDGQVIILCDTVQWFGCSLRELGDSLDMVKWPMPGPDSPESDWIDYCRRDVDVLDAALNRLWNWLQSIRCRDWQYTRAAQSMYLWKTRYGAGMVKHVEDPQVLKLDRLGYFGGRAECWRVGQIMGPVWRVDVNSMYPHIMRNSVFPCEVREYDHEPGMKTDFDLTYALSYTAEVWLDSPDCAYPIKCKDGTYWVTGLVRTVLCGPELEMAKAWGHIRGVGRWTRYNMTNLFRRFVDEFHGYRLEARKEGNKVHDLLCKAMLNSLYGKFGQRTGEWSVMERSYPPGYYGQGKVVGDRVERDTEFRVLAGYLHVRHRDHEDPRSFVPIAAYVASHGRVHMDAVRRQLDANGIYAQITDSLVISDLNCQWIGDQGLIDPDRLGAFKLDGPYERVVIRHVGNMDFDDKKVRAGIKTNARPLGGDWYEVEQWEGAPCGIYAGKVSCVSIVQICKRSSDRYGRGSVAADGCVSPWRVSNWDSSPEETATLPLRAILSDRV